MFWIGIAIVWVGASLFGAAVVGLNSAITNKDQRGRVPIRYMGRIGLVLVILGILLSSSPGYAQVQMWPGQELKFCNGIGAITSGGTICAHNPNEHRIQFTFMNPDFHTTFWGDGTAPALLPPLCRLPGITSITETVFHPAKNDGVVVRVRTMTCSTGRSGPWVIVVEE